MTWAGALALSLGIVGTGMKEVSAKSDLPAKPIIFISYCHKDEPKIPIANDVCWLTFVQSHLAPAVKHGIYDLWADEDIPGGGTWRQEIIKKLDECDVCVLLVSRHSLASDFIIDVEIETLWRRRERGEVEIFPIVLTPCAIETAPWITKINLRPPNGQPLSDFSENDKHKQMAAIAKEIADIAKAIAEKKRQALAFVAPMNRFREASIWQSTRSDTNHLPETAYEHLVGRKAELQRLDNAWADANTNILSLIGEGGAGKSALVNEWLRRMQAKDYRGAECVLGWSFYNQGTKERASSAEQFLNWAIDKLGIETDTISATAKGEAIAEALTRRRVLLVLDGCEPLQHGLDEQQGELKDQGLRSLLRRFASMPPHNVHGLVVLTSRLPVKDIVRWKDSGAPAINLEQLSDEAGAALLRDNGIWGTDKELQAAAHDFGGHPLALGLLASFLKENYVSDVRRRDHVRAYFVDPKNPRHDHARRVMESYEQEWLAGQPVLQAIIYIIGLFDRPASSDCLHALRRKPAISGLTDAIVGLDEDEWQRAITRLRDVRLLAPMDPAAPEALDAHPIVREWFGERLRQSNESAWRAAHFKIYDHLRRTTREGTRPTLETLAPLYQAVAHGCHAGRYKEVLEKIYVDRICRTGPDGQAEFYAAQKLGAFGSNLAAILCFFEEGSEIPVAALSPEAQSWVIAQAASSLRALGRFTEALQAQHKALSLPEPATAWSILSKRAANLSELQLLVGDVSAAIASASKAVELADRGGVAFDAIYCRTTHAEALLAMGRGDQAERLFEYAERRHAKLSLGSLQMDSLHGYRYCDLLLQLRAWDRVSNRCQTILNQHYPWASLLDHALVRLALGRAQFGLALEAMTNRVKVTDAAIKANRSLGEAVAAMHEAGTFHHIPRGFIGRGAFRRSVGNWDGATQDFDDVEEIARPGPMPLCLCDTALERARLAFAKIEAFAPLNGLINDSPAKPAVPDAAAATKLKEEARKQVAIAADYVKTCGYHRRDEEVAELQAVLQGEQKFADLPPRV